MHRIETTLDFPKIIPIDIEGADKEYELQVSDSNGIIAFPSLNKKFKVGAKASNGKHIFNLMPPKNSDQKIILDDDQWGVVDWRGEIRVSQCRIWFPYDPNKQDLEQFSDNISKEIEPWLDRFIKYFEIQSKIILSDDFDTVDWKSGIQFYYTTHSEILPANIPGSLARVAIVNHVREDNLKRAIDLANKGDYPCTEHLLIRDAREQLINNLYRRVILDSATAVEIVLTNQAKTKLVELHNVEGDLLKSILIKYRNLGGRIELVKKLNIDMPINSSELESILAKRRNKAIHSGQQFSRDEALEVFNLAEQLVFYFQEESV